MPEGIEASVKLVRKAVFVRRWLPAAVLLAATIVALIVGGGNASTLRWLERSYSDLGYFIADHYAFSLLLFTIVYAIFVSVLIVPPSAPLSFASGLLFGPLIGTLICVTAKTIGGTIAFAVWRNAFRDDIGKFGPKVLRLAESISGRGFWYLTAFRLMPLLPFGTVTLGAAAARIKLRPFMAATLIGQAPASYIYAGIGAASGLALATGANIDLAAVLGSANLLVPTALMTVLSVAGIIASHRLHLSETKQRS